jgi:hypothetical protein
MSKPPTATKIRTNTYDLISTKIPSNCAGNIVAAHSANQPRKSKERDLPETFQEKAVISLLKKIETQFGDEKREEEKITRDMIHSFS